MMWFRKVQTSKSSIPLRSPASALVRCTTSALSLSLSMSHWEASNNCSYTACSGSSLPNPQTAALAHLANCLWVQNVEKLAQRRGRGFPDDVVPPIPAGSASPLKTTNRWRKPAPERELEGGGTCSDPLRTLSTALMLIPSDFLPAFFFSTIPQIPISDYTQRLAAKDFSVISNQLHTLTELFW